MNIFILLHIILCVLYVKTKEYLLNLFSRKSAFHSENTIIFFLLSAKEEIRISRITISFTWNIYRRRRLSEQKVVKLYEIS